MVRPVTLRDRSTMLVTPFERMSALVTAAIENGTLCRSVWRLSAVTMTSCNGSSACWVCCAEATSGIAATVNAAMPQAITGFIDESPLV